MKMHAQPLSSLAVVVLAASICLWIVYAAVSTFKQHRRLAHVKGPWLAAWTPLWLFYHICRGDTYLAFHREFKKYGHGTIIRIAPNILMTNDPATYRQIAGTKSPFVKGYWYKGMKIDPRVDNLLSMTDDAKHADMRNRLIPGYTGAEVATLELDIDAGVVEMVDLIQKEHVQRGNSLDFAVIAAYFTMDTLTQIAFGSRLGFMTKNEDVFGYLKAANDFFPVMDLGCVYPTILNLLNSALFSGMRPSPTDKAGFGAMVGENHRLVAERFKEDPVVRQDMLGSFIKHGLTEEQCQSESILQLLAGSDSTATALRATMLCILTNPYVYSKLVGEIKATVDAGKATSPVIRNSEAQSLPYLRAVVMEGIRIFMPLQGLASRTPPQGGADLNGVFIPEGTQIGVATYSMLRREDLFGTDADTFRPERWIEGDPTSIKRMERNQELAFGVGRQSCLGKSIALMELRKVIFELLRAYDLIIVNPFKPMYVRSNAVVIQKEMYLRAYPRQW